MFRSDPYGRVRYEIPDYRLIQKSGLKCADMHYHTNYSDSYTLVKNAISLARKRQVGLAITDHNLIGGVLEASELVKNDDPFLVPGIEISAWDGPHILVYFYTIDEMKEYWTRSVKPYISSSSWLAIDKGTEWILDSLEDVNCVVSAAHPLGYLSSIKGVQKAINHGILDESVGRRFDAYEVICSGMFRSENIEARDSAMRYGIGFTGGTDGHLKHELGKVLTISDANDLDEFLDNILKHKNMVVGREKNLGNKTVMGMTSVSKFCGHIPSTVKRKTNLAMHHHTKNAP